MPALKQFDGQKQNGEPVGGAYNGQATYQAVKARNLVFEACDAALFVKHGFPPSSRFRPPSPALDVRGKGLCNSKSLCEALPYHQHRATAHTGKLLAMQTSGHPLQLGEYTLVRGFRWGPCINMAYYNAKFSICQAI